MISVTRASLDEALAERLEELTAKIKALSESDRVKGSRSLWRNSTVRRSLGEVLRGMAAGREYCMYCGDNQGTDVDHHEPIAHNPLRTFDWLNHLLACSYCNSHQKRHQFPLDSDGLPLLIDPSKENPFDHLLLTLALGEYVPLTPKGRATIDVCRLNRILLVTGRRNARLVVGYCLTAWYAAYQRSDEVRMNEAMYAVREQPFAEVWQSMFSQAVTPQAKVIFSNDLDILEILKLPELRSLWPV